jgi:hypothetical protein
MRRPRRDRPRDRSRTGQTRVPRPENGHFWDHRHGRRPAQVNPSRKLVPKRRVATPVGYGM